MADEINPFGRAPEGLKKRVLFVITQSEMGGAQRFLATLLPYLDETRYELLVAAGKDGDDELMVALNSHRIPWEKLKHLRRDIMPIEDVRGVFEIRNLIERFQPQTLFLCSSKAGFVGSLAAKLSRDVSPKVVYRIGGWTFNDPWPAWQRWLWRFLERISASWKDVIIVNNQSDLNQAQRIGIKPRNNLILIHNGLDPYRIALLPRDEARAKFMEMIPIPDKIPELTKIVGTIANLYPSKGLEHLITAARRLPEDTIVCIIGDGNLRPKLEELIDKYNLSHRAFLLGRVPQASQYLPGFDTFVLPSVKEGFPWSLLEAMAAKLPVVATRVGAVPEMIEDRKNGVLVDPASADQLGREIGAILGNEMAAREMGIQAHQTVLFKFSLDRMVEKIESVL